jgi:bloom syndrome protein
VSNSYCFRRVRTYRPSETLPFQSLSRLKKPFKSPLLIKNVNHQSLSSRSVTLSESGDSDSTTKVPREPVLNGDIETGNSTSEYTDDAVDAGASKIDDCQRELDSVSKARLESQSFATDVELENSTSTKLPVRSPLSSSLSRN